MITIRPDGTAVVSRKCGEETCARLFVFVPPANPRFCADCRIERRRRQNREAFRRRYG